MGCGRGEVASCKRGRGGVASCKRGRGLCKGLGCAAPTSFGGVFEFPWRASTVRGIRIGARGLVDAGRLRRMEVQEGTELVNGVFVDFVFWCIGVASAGSRLVVGLAEPFDEVFVGEELEEGAGLVVGWWGANGPRGHSECTVVAFVVAVVARGPRECLYVAHVAFALHNEDVIVVVAFTQQDGGRRGDAWIVPYATWQSGGTIFSVEGCLEVHVP